MDWLLIGGCVVAAWASLSVLGGERQRLINEIPRPVPTEATDAKSTAGKPAVVKKH